MKYTIVYQNQGNSKKLINVLSGDISNINKIKEHYEVLECASILSAIEALNNNFPNWQTIVYFFTALK